MQLERTEDWALIKSITTDPKLWRHLSDDFAPAPEAWEPDPRHLYLKVSDLGFFVLVQHSPILWEVHTCLRPVAWGQSLICARAMFAWVWDHTPCERLITQVPDNNRLALRLALKSGMETYGTNPRSYLKDGVLHSTILLGLTRPEIRNTF